MSKVASQTQRQSATTQLPASGILQRQCACGTHTMAGGECETCSKTKRLGLQTKLKVNEPGDIYEQEADRIADQVMAAPAHSSVSGAAPRIQRVAGQPTGQTEAAPASVDHALANPGRSLAPALRQDMEQRFGHDFSRVRVHYDAATEQSAQDVNANAYTMGHHIVFGADRFAPGTHEGQRLLAHEMAHVVQQSCSDAIRAGRNNEKHGLSPIPSALSGVAYPEVHALPRVPAPSSSWPVAPDRADAVEASLRGGEAFSPPVRRFFEPRFGFDLGSVRVHADERAARGAQALRARAFASGPHLVFGAGEYAPHSTEGQRLIAHELAHVAQQGAAGVPRVQRHNAADPRLPADQAEAFAFAAAANTEIQAALTPLAASSQLLERNVPALVAQEGITLRPLTPRHDSGVSASNIQFFHGSTSYAGSVTLPDVATHHISSDHKTISIRARDHGDVDNMLLNFQINELIVVSVLETAERLATRPLASALSVFDRYRARFNAIAETDSIQFIFDSFDPTMDSHGPRFIVARAIFDEIYASDPNFRSAYDANTGGIKERVDSYTGPDSLNPLASPGLQRLRAAFFPFSPPVTAVATYNSLKSAVQAASATLSTEDRAAVDHSNTWEQLVNAHVTTDARRTELRDIIRNPPPAPAAVAPRAVAPPAVAPPAAGGVTPQSFVDSVFLTGPAPLVPSIGREVSATLTPQSTVANPGVAISSQITLTPPTQVSRTNVSPASPWPTGAITGVDFSPTLLVSTGAALDAQLALVNGPWGLAPANSIPPFQITLDDQRQTNVAAVWDPEIEFFDVNGASTAFLPGTSTVRYISGAQNFVVVGSISAPPGVNPGLTLDLDARIDRIGATIAAAQRIAFPPNASRTPQISLNVSQPAGGVAAGTTDPLDIEMRLLDATGALIAGSPRTERIDVGPEATYTQAQAETSWTEDEDFFHNSPGLLDIMIANGGAQARFADAVRPPVGQTPLLTFHPLVVRHDSAAFVAQSNLVGGVPTPDPSQTAYFVLKPYGAHPDPAHSLVDVAGAGGFQIPSFPGISGRFIVVNRTADPSANVKDPVDVTIQLAIHEAVHALDEIVGPVSDIDRYRTEFRAYWMDGRHGPPDQALVPGHPELDARFKPDLPPPGPKSPRARRIFSEELYGSVTYPWVLPNYDDNVNRFREQVDTYIVPDGINLILSRRIEALRVLINAGVTPSFATFRGRVQAFFGAGALAAPALGLLDAGELDYIRGSRAWRDLVEAKVSGAANRNQIKSDMGIPL